MSKFHISLAWIVLFSLLLTLTGTQPAQAVEPVAIATASELNNIRNNLAGTYRLTADIDLSSISNWAPVGNATTPFTGSLDGQGYAIRSPTIADTQTPNLGLFGVIGASGQVANLKIEKANVTATDNAGILAGTNAGTIQKVSAQGVISGGINVGGLVGVNSGTLTYAYAFATVSGKNYNGGLVGSNTGSVIQSYAASSISAAVTNTYAAFNGTNGYISIPHAAAYATDSFTLEAWFQWTSADRSAVNFLTGKGLENFEIHTAGDAGANGIRFIPVLKTVTYYNDGRAYQDVKNVLQPGWNHVAASWDFANMQARVYLNGIPQDIYQKNVNVGKVASIPLQDTKVNPFGSNTSALFIGARNDKGPVYFFNGNIADVRFWNRVRTAEEIASDKYKQLTGTETGLIGYWKLNETSGTTAYDSSGVHNDGALIGGVTRVTEASVNGGLVGVNSGTISQSYYDSTLSGMTDANGFPLTTVQMKSKASFTGWDFTNIWKIVEDNTYPTLFTHKAAVSVTSISPTPVVTGQSYTVSYTVGGHYIGQPSGQVSVDDGSVGACTGGLTPGSPSSGSCSLFSSTAGSKTITAGYAGNTVFAASTVTTSLTINASETATSITGDSHDPSVVGQAYAISVSVAASGAGSGTPTGTVVVNDGAGASCTATLSGGTGSCYLTSTSVGAKTITAAYQGDTNFSASSATASHGVTGSSVAIATASDLDNIRNNPAAAYRLTADIDLSSTPNWAPVGNATTPFTGFLDGNGYAIRNLTIADTQNPNLGLFGVIGASGQVANLKIEKANVTAADNAGILAGTNAGIIQKVSGQGVISGGTNVGGLVGVNTGTITYAYAFATVSGKNYNGGLVGSNSNTGSVSQSYAASSISAAVTNTYASFNGADGYISIPHKAEYTTGSFTLEAWFQWTSADRSAVNFVIGKGYENFEIHTGGGAGANGIRFIPVPLASTSYQDGRTYQDVKNVLQPGWNHVAASWDFANMQARVYLNGIPQDIYQNGSNVGKVASIPLKNPAVNPLAINTKAFFIGARNDGGPVYFFKGNIADVRFWNKVRTADEIASDKYKQLTGAESGLIGYWKLDETSGDIANDSSSVKNHGSLIGGVTRQTEASVNGGLVGVNSGTISQSYYDSTLSGMTDATKGFPLTTANMKLKASFTGWDFNNIWKIVEGKTYPTLFTYTIGGTVSGLGSGKAVVLQNNGGDDLTVSASGTFTFATAISHDGDYAVTVKTQPTGQTCAVSSGSGTATANVTTVAVACTTNTYTIGGMLSGLGSGKAVVLQNNGGNDLTVSANGSFAFTTAISHDGDYAVTVKSQPTGQTCAVSSGSGTATANVTTVAVACTTNTYTIGGTVSGLGSGKTVVLLINGGNALTVSANASFTFTTAISHGSTYAVTVKTQPTGQFCAVSSGSGNATANVTTVAVACTNAYTIGGTVSGLGSGNWVVLQNNGGNAMTVSSNGSFTFTTAISQGSAYAVSVETHPTGQFCVVSNGSGTVNADVTTVAVACTTACGPGIAYNTGQWQQFALPCVPNASPASIASVLGNAETLDAVNLPANTYASRWILYGRNASNTGDVWLTSAVALTSNSGYWFLSLDPPISNRLQISSGNAPTVDTGVTGCQSPQGCAIVRVPTDTDGYRMIGNPFPFDVDWSKVRIRFDGNSTPYYTPSEAVSSNVLDSRAFWIWNGSEFSYWDDATYPGNLQYFKSLFIKVKGRGTGTTIDLLIPAEPSTLEPSTALPWGFAERLAATPRAWAQSLLDWLIPSAAAKDPPPDSREWKVLLRVENPKSGAKTRALLGKRHEAQPGYDPADINAMAPFASPYLTLVFPQPGWGARKGDYLSDFRPTDNYAAQWNLELRADPIGSQVVLRWEGDPEILARSRLIDRKTRKVIDPENPAWEDGYPLTLDTKVRALTWEFLGSPFNHPPGPPVKPKPRR